MKFKVYTISKLQNFASQNYCFLLRKTYVPICIIAFFYCFRDMLFLYCKHIIPFLATSAFEQKKRFIYFCPELKEIKMIRQLLICLLFYLSVFQVGAQIKQIPVYLDDSQPAEIRVEDALSRMTLNP